MGTHDDFDLIVVGGGIAGYEKDLPGEAARVRYCH
jgi:glycerol-3-phosphate dehydrogenase